MTAFKKLPLGIQNFDELIEKNYLYVDKTAYVHRMVDEGKLYFLSRPRRFGKTVLISTLEALYQGRKSLFRGLYIADRWDWVPRPVIRLDFLGIKNHNLEVMQSSLERRLDEIAASHDITLSAPDSNDRFRQLILAMAEQGPVVVLIDEYDKPILDQIANPQQMEINRRFLADFYAILKSVERKLEFLLMTGVSKFTHVSLFSELNNLDDISLDRDFGGIVGYTEDEVDQYFGPYLKEPIQGFADADLRRHIRRWYNGYSWDGETRIYNPLSLTSMLKKRKFLSFWFSTGTPGFLVELLRSEKMSIPALEQAEIGELAMDGFDPHRINPLALLFQTGYLTIRHIEETDTGPIYQMTYPNLEVRHSFLAWVLGDVSGEQPDDVGRTAKSIGNHLKAGDLEAFFRDFQSLFASIPYNIFLSDREAYYHTVVYLVLSLLGVKSACEIQTHAGRIDAVLETDQAYYVMEFKLGMAAEAMEQIKARNYAAPYRNRGKDVHLTAVGIDPEQRNISDWLCVPDTDS